MIENLDKEARMAHIGTCMTLAYKKELSTDGICVLENYLYKYKRLDLTGIENVKVKRLTKYVNAS